MIVDDNLMSITIKKYSDVCYFPYTDADQLNHSYHTYYRTDTERLYISQTLTETFKYCELPLLIFAIDIKHERSSRRVLCLYFQEEHVLELYDIYGYDF